MDNKKWVEFRDWESSNKRTVLRSYVGAVLVMGLAIAITYALAHTFGPKAPYLYPFLYLLAIMACAWMGYGPGLFACLVAVFVVPYLFVPGFRVTKLDPARQALTFLISILFSKISSNRRHMEAVLRKANAELDERIRQRTRELAESEDRFRTVADAAPFLIWTSAPDKLCDYFNKPWLDFTGRTLQQELGKGWTEGVHPEDFERIYQIYTTSFDARQPFVIEYRLRRNDGKYRWILDTGGPRFSGQGEFAGYIGSCVDITDRKEASERIQEAAKLESLGILAGGIAHDFNNLLVGILGNSSLACEILPPSHPVRPILEDVVRAGEKAADLTKQMLAYAGKGRFVSRAINLSELVREIGQLVQVSAPKKVHLRFELDNSLPPIDGDPSQIQQVIMNLVINGAEACDPELGGTVIIATSRQVVDEEYLKTYFPGEELAPGDYVALEVQDTGSGMDEQTKAKIFDPFFTTKFTGRGLGLSAVLGIVRGHKGAIKIYSAPGRGTAFKVLFPAAPASEHEPDRSAAPSIRYHTGNILVVDDEEIVRKTAKSALERFGYRVLLAEDGEQAVNVFKAAADEISLVLLDLTMPVMSGEETFRQLRTIKPAVKVVLSSGYNEVEAVRHFTAKGIAGFIQKPYTASQLGEKITGSLRAT